MGKPLYQQALPLLNEIRARIAETKRPTVVMHASAAALANGGLAEEISKLAALRDQGVLTNEEFQAAKQAAITRGTRSWNGDTPIASRPPGRGPETASPRKRRCRGDTATARPGAGPHRAGT
jgi:hypothetical protein